MSAKRIRSVDTSAGESIVLAARDSDGRRRSVVLKATPVEPAGAVGPASNVDDEDPYELSFGDTGVLSPPYPLKSLTLMKEQSTELSQCIHAMVTNIVGFGWTLRERRMTEQQRRKFESEIVEERSRIEAVLNSIHPTRSLTMVRKRTKDDQHSNGNGYLELIDDRRGELVGISHVRSHLVRLTAKQPKPVRIMVPRVQPHKGFAVERVPMWHRFRRYAIVRGRRVVWFKEAGDPRVLDKFTGKYDESTPFARRATGLLHFKHYSAITPYGVPLWIGTTLAILGSRESEEINYDTLKNNAIPAMFVIIENGSLTEGSIKRLKEWTEEQIQKAVNRSKFLILEGQTDDEGIANPMHFNIKIEPLRQLQLDDQLFQKYDANNKEKQRQAFRLPPLFVGNADEYTRACYSSDTETLTENGWKRFDEVDIGERIATLNPETFNLEYHEPHGGLHVYPYRGEMYRFKNRNTDVLVTPDHDMWIASRKAGHYGKCCADDITLSRFVFMSAPIGFEPIEAPAYVVLPAVELAGGPNAGIRNEVRIRLDLWVEFISVFVADGSTSSEFVRGKRRCMYNVTFGVHKRRKVERLRRIFSELAGCGLNVFDECVESSGKHVFCLADKGLWHLLREVCGTSSLTKRLPQALLHYPKHFLTIMEGALRDTDGTLDTRDGRSCWSYSTSSRILAGQVQQLCLHLGNRAHVCKTPASGNRRANYRVLITPGKREHRVRQHDISVEMYEGLVYCFNVPNHLFFTRRNGKVAIQGNTADTSRDVADEQIFAPERSDDDYMINRFVMYSLGARFHTFRSMHPNITDDIELIRMAAIAERSGGMTPRRMDRVMQDIFGDDLGPLPTGIDLDKPFSITFAEAQKHGAAGRTSAGQAPGSDVARRVIDGLLDFRKRIEKEIDRRFYLEDEGLYD